MRVDSVMLIGKEANGVGEFGAAPAAPCLELVSIAMGLTDEANSDF